MQKTTSKVNILYLCTGNSCRSQMAEGWTRHLWAKQFTPYSAGIETHGLNPRAVEVMAEAGVDISNHSSKHVDALKDISFDYIITVCGHAHESCPVFGERTRTIHVGFEDPPQLALGATSREETLNCYRRVRDEIKAFIEQLPDKIEIRG